MKAVVLSPTPFCSARLFREIRRGIQRRLALKDKCNEFNYFVRGELLNEYSATCILNQSICDSSRVRLAAIEDAPLYERNSPEIVRFGRR